MGPINQRTGDSALCSSFFCSLQFFSHLHVRKKLLSKLTLILSSVSFRFFHFYTSHSQSSASLHDPTLSWQAFVWYNFSYFLSLYPSQSYLPLPYLSTLRAASGLLAQSASFKCCHQQRKELMSCSPGEESGLLVTFLVSATMVVTITKLGAYSRSVRTSLHFVYWGTYRQCSLLGGREKHMQHPVLSCPLIKCTSGIIASIGRVNLLSPHPLTFSTVFLLP